LTIDNKPVQVETGTSLLKAAQQAGINIPTLCYLHLEHLNIENKPGGCRICVVEVAGRKNLAPSCATQCQEGMVVRTNTMRVLTILSIALSVPKAAPAICRRPLRTWVSVRSTIRENSRITKKTVRHR
jgi:NADP-reducing hydrogenase subunit HndD